MSSIPKPAASMRAVFAFICAMHFGQCSLVCGPGEANGGSEVCTACANGKWKAGTNALAACLPENECPDHDATPDQAGGDYAFQRDDDKTRCHQCRGGAPCCGPELFWAKHITNQPCDWCPKGTYSSVFSRAEQCVSCAPNAGTEHDRNAKSSISACMCAQGYEPGPGYNASEPETLTCSICPVGKYKHGDTFNGEPSSWPRNIPCTECAAGKTSQRGSTAAANCLDVPASVLCDAGFYAVTAAECLPCPKGVMRTDSGTSTWHSGTWKSGRNNLTSCHAENQCPDYVEGQTLSGNEQPNWNLSRAWVNEHDQTQCHVCGTRTINCCVPGLAVLQYHGVCNYCPRSTYSSGITLRALECTPCPYASGTEFHGAKSISDCMCNKGYGGSSAGKCSECGVGTYFQTTTPGSSVCASCPANSFSPSTSPDVSACTCHAGYIRKPYSNVSYSCTTGAYPARAVTWFEDPLGPPGCTLESTTTDLESSGTISCTVPKNVGASAPKDVICKVLIAANADISLHFTEVHTDWYYWSDTPVLGHNEPNSVTTYSCSTSECSDLFNSSVDELGVYYGKSAPGTIFQRRGNTWEMTDGETSGYFGAKPAPDVPAGDAVIFTSTRGYALVKLTSTEPEVSFYVAHWTVPRDTQSWWSLDCTACPAGTYKQHSSGCASCPPNSTSLAASHNSSACRCDAGFAGPDGGHNCEMCAAGTYKADFLSRSCSLCATGKYKAGFGAGVCSSCDEGESTAAAGSTSAEACTIVCSPGESASATTAAGSASSCVQCAVGHFKVSSGVLPCAECPSNHYATANSTACAHCPPGTYTAGQRGQGECLNCLAAAAVPTVNTTEQGSATAKHSALAACLERYMQHVFGPVATDTAIRATLVQLDVPPGAVVRIAGDSAQTSSMMNNAGVLRRSGGVAATWYPANINPAHRAGNTYTLLLPPQPPAPT